MPTFRLSPEEAILSRNFLAYIEAQRLAIRAGNPSVANDGEETPTKGDITIGGFCEYTLDGNIYRTQDCACSEGFHQAVAPVVDGSAPPTIRIACEPDVEILHPIDSTTEVGGTALAADRDTGGHPVFTARLETIRQRQLKWFQRERTGIDPDGTPVYGGWLIESNGYAIYEKKGSVYELRENHASISCYPPNLPLVDTLAPPVIKVGCRRVPRRLPSGCGDHSVDPPARADDNPSDPSRGK